MTQVMAASHSRSHGATLSVPDGDRLVPKCEFFHTAYTPPKQDANGNVRRGMTFFHWCAHSAALATYAAARSGAERLACYGNADYCPIPPEQRVVSLPDGEPH